MEELLGLMREDRDDVSEAQSSKRKKEEKREKEKERLGAKIRARVTERAS